MRPHLDSVRLLQYAVAFVALVVFLFAVSSLAALALAQLIPDTRTLLVGSNVRDQVSYYLAALIVATPLCLVFWRLIRRRIERSTDERQAPERNLFLALVSAIGVVAGLFALHTFFRVIFSLPAAHGPAALGDLFSAIIRLAVYGLAAAIALHVAWRENRLRNPAQDLALFVVTGFSLAFLAVGALDAIRAIVGVALGTGESLVLGGSAPSLTLAWAQTAAWILSGGMLWAAVTAVDRSTGEPKEFRQIYLYVVLAVSLGMTVIPGTDILYEILRRAFGSSTSGWSFLQDTLPWLVVGAILWAYHWAPLRRLSSTRSPVPPERRLAVSGYAFVGLAMAAPAAAILLWLVPDFLFGTHGTSLSGTAWWVDRLSAGIAVLAVGITLWVPAWRLLQRAARAPEERSSTERRWLIGGTTLIGALAAVGFTIAFLWTLLQAVLGAGLGAGTASSLFKYLGTTLIALGVAAYYGVTLRDDIRLSPARRRARVLALVEPGGEPSLDSLRRTEGKRLRVAGYLTGAVEGTHLGLETVRSHLAAVDADEALVILGPDGGMVYPYMQRRQVDPQPGVSRNAALPAPGS